MERENCQLSEVAIYAFLFISFAIGKITARCMAGIFYNPKTIFVS
jgi:hypothetical protein